ncbi:hypothetical protein EVAR_91754_1 [Eumeta japonica]|uniref:Uncharacterized protein n=1 Tax=Eumeta variegata TaxID=151549 RepID=A0A4C1SLI1_EUMVA|nr:hypothetical protein EVAR_91754_1 [Eumeta japonica]
MNNAWRTFVFRDGRAAQRTSASASRELSTSIQGVPFCPLKSTVVIKSDVKNFIEVQLIFRSERNIQRASSPRTRARSFASAGRLALQSSGIRGVRACVVEKRNFLQDCRFPQTPSCFRIQVAQHDLTPPLRRRDRQMSRLAIVC